MTFWQASSATSSFGSWASSFTGCSNHEMRPFRTAEIIAVGSELLTPFRSDTNSLVLTTRLNDLGIGVSGKLVVGDDVGRLASAVSLAVGRADVVVTTGGLGPTEDDVTRE